MDQSRRKYPRVNYPCSITVWRKGVAAEVIMANTANISGGGICVYLNEVLALGTELEVRIDNFFEGGPLKCRGIVLRCQQDSSSSSKRQKFYEIGIEFLEMDDAQRLYLLGFVERLMHLKEK